MVSLFEKYPHLKLVRQIFRAHHGVYQLAKDVARDHGLEAAELHVMNILGNTDKLTMGELSKQTLISPSNTTRTIQIMEDKGLVKRKTSKSSQREVDVALTAKGQKLFKVYFPDVDVSADEYFKERLNAQERKQLLRLLEKLNRR